jgi:pSer/pThr/pTyr-binding forkhead associated (FHA) protein
MKEMPVIIVQIVHIQGPLKGQIQEFTEPRIIIGRHSSCQVQFPTDLTTISRTHAELVREGNRFKVIDRSTNGTFVNGKRVTEAFLKDGDVIMFTDGGPKASYLARITDAVQAEQPAPPVSKPKPVPKDARPEAAPPQAVKADQEQPQAAKPHLIPPKAPRHTPEPTPPQKTVPPATPAAHESSRPAEQPHQAVQKVQVPLMVQFGPVLKSYKELPIIIGRKADADFVLNHPAIVDHHAQIFFSANQYWVRDLTGRNLITINGRPVGFEISLNPQDIISLATGGPALRFLGEGRLAEYEEASVEEAPEPIKPTRPERLQKGKPAKSIFDIFKKE